MVKDPVQKRLKAIIAAKKRKQKPTASRIRRGQEPRDTPDNVVSIMDALRKSVEAEKKGGKGR